MNNMSMINYMTVLPNRGHNIVLQCSTLAPVSITAIFLTVSVMGIVGNSLVIYAFSKHLKEGVSNTLILTLAITDLLIALFDIPATLYWTVWLSDSTDFLCRLHIVLKGFWIMFSFTTLVIIALDRFLLICFLPPRRLTLSQLMAVLTGTGVFSLCIHLPMGLRTGTIVSTYIDFNDENMTSKQITYSHCTKDETFIDDKNYRLYKFTLTGIFLTAFVLIVAPYVMIFITVWRREKTRRRTFRDNYICGDQLTNIRGEPSRHIPMFASTDEIELNGISSTIMKQKLRMNEARVSTDKAVKSGNDRRNLLPPTMNGLNMASSCVLFTNDARCMSIDSTSPDMHRMTIERSPQRRNRRRGLHTRTAKVLGSISVSLIVTYIPHLLINLEFFLASPMKHGHQGDIPANGTKSLRNYPSHCDMMSFHRELFYFLYFMNVAINPFIYAAWNPTFRKEVSLLFSHFRASFHPSTGVLSLPQSYSPRS